jgi:hypothetical protein
MKKLFRRLGFLTLILATMLATHTTISSAQDGPNPVDPACVSFCQNLLYQCIASGEKHNCLGVYRQCIAHCKH